jgi:hypothetical protein
MSLFGKPREWFLYNLDTDDKIQGQFVAEDVSEEIGAVWAERFALNRQESILQWVHGEADTISFKARLFMTSELLGKENDPVRPLTMLKSWVRRDEKLGRPPILAFWIGDSHLKMDECILEKLSGISYQPPTFSGGLRDVEFTVNLRRWYQYDIELGGTPGESRYHHAIRQEYYELLTQREYGDPSMGDIIRKRHPEKPVVQVGDIVKLPSGAALLREKVTQTSIALKNAFGRKDSPQKTLRQNVFDRRNDSQLSFVVQDYGE